MSKNNLPKISSKAVFGAVVVLVLLVLVAINARVILENMLRARGIDEQIVSKANPSLNRALLQEAVDVLEIFPEGDLTSIFSSVTLEKEATAAGSTAQ